ncbi:MAG TPA: type II secretion system protein [Rhizomicrobium sp.]|nr:type II secretion system protein [Rhizomicrobium sp.]
MRTTPPEHRRCAGFTLIEVLVSLAIAAIGMAFFLSAAGMGLQNTGIADQSIQATRLAQSHLAAVGFSVPLRQGNYSGDDGPGFRWQVRIFAPLNHPKPAGSSEAAATSRALYPVEVDESWQSGFSRREIVLRSERLGTP